MKIRSKSFLSLLLTVALMIPLLCFPTSAAEDSTPEYTPDISWYDASKTEFEIGTPEQLLGFSTLIADYKADEGGNKTAGKTFRLTADIDLNPGWVAGAKAPKNLWAAASNKYFLGTFDGNGHTISGIYVSAGQVSNAGIFGIAGYAGAYEATVQNLTVKNSYVTSTWSQQGGLFGFAHGNVTIDNVYAMIMVEDNRSQDNGLNYTGGMIGLVRKTSTVVISNSVFAGRVISNFDRCSAGFIGGIAAGDDPTKENAAAPNVTVTNCAFYGELASDKNDSGAFVGRIEKDIGALKIEKCIFAGTVASASKSTSGLVIGSCKSTGDALNKIQISDLLYVPNGTLNVTGDELAEATGISCTSVQEDVLFGEAFNSYIGGAFSAWEVSDKKPYPTSLQTLFPGLKDMPDRMPEQITGPQITITENIQEDSYEEISFTNDNPDAKYYGKWKAGSGSIYYLSDMTIGESSNTTSTEFPNGKPTFVNKVYNGTEEGNFVLGFSETKFDKGLGVHPKPGKVESYTLIDISQYTDPAGDYQCDTMYAAVGLTSDAGKNGSSPGVRFLVYADYTGDGSAYTLIARSDDIVMKVSGEFNIDVTGVKVLKLVVVTITENHSSSSSGWVDACLFKADANAVKPDYAEELGQNTDGEEDTDPVDPPATTAPEDTAEAPQGTDTTAEKTEENVGGCQSVGGVGVILLLVGVAVVPFAGRKRKSEE